MVEKYNKYNPRFIRELLDVEFWDILEQIVEISIEKNFVKYLPYLESYVTAVKSNDDDLISGAEVCKILMITRQTLYNWYKNDKLNPLLKNTKIKRGNKNLYKLNLLKKIIEKNESHFGSGNFYNYKCESLDSDVAKINPELEKILTGTTLELNYFQIVEKMKTGSDLTEREMQVLRKYES